jgi:hypothetical protein
MMYDLTQSEKLEHTRKALAESELALIAKEKRLDELKALLRESVCGECNGAGRVWKGNKIVGCYQDGGEQLERIMILCPSCTMRAKAQESSDE